MNNILNEFYSINVVGIIKVTDKVYRIKTKDNRYYCLKFIDEDYEGIFSNLSLLDLNSFVIPYLNKYNSYISIYEEKKFYLIDWYNDEPYLVKEMRMKFFVDEIIKLHSKSLYNLNINKGHFEDIFIELERSILEEENDLEYYLKNIEKKEYKSPSEWLFLLNNNRFKEVLNKTRNYLKLFKESIKELSEFRLCLNYLNFDFNNIIIKHKKIIGIEKIKKGSLVNDLFDIFDKSFSNSVDVTIYIKHYFNEIKLLDYEKYWLLILIFIPQIEYSNNDEITKIIDITKIIYKINVSESIEKILMENN